MILRFIHVPKTAGVSILDALNESIRSLGLPEERSTEWQIRGTYGTYHSRASEPSVREENWPAAVDFSFAFIRNPWDRFVSSYVYLSEKQNDEYEEQIKPFKSFKDFAMNGSIDSLHFRPQTYWIDSQVDFVGRFEKLQSHFDGLCKNIGLQPTTLKRKNETTHKHYSEYYDKESMDAVADKYSDDVQLLGYKFGSYNHPQKVFTHEE